ncbi:uncharacterized protein UDID_06316 [Ustilago sp. UG-2017a]|nr:uncharacterized protein UDID_06316 [Ustilago sp. UG-2017a]
MADGLGLLLFGLGNCCAQIATQLSYTICNNRTYGADSTCADNCCRFNCCWKQGALPVEDYPIANSDAEHRTQKMDEGKKGVNEAERLPKYEATPQMSAAPAVAATATATAAVTEENKTTTGA